jgi:hypothetical protein
MHLFNYQCLIISLALYSIEKAQGFFMLLLFDTSRN